MARGGWVVVGGWGGGAYISKQHRGEEELLIYTHTGTDGWCYQDPDDQDTQCAAPLLSHFYTVYHTQHLGMHVGWGWHTLLAYGWSVTDTGELVRVRGSPPKHSPRVHPRIYRATDPYLIVPVPARRICISRKPL